MKSNNKENMHLSIKNHLIDDLNNSSEDHVFGVVVKLNAAITLVGSPAGIGFTSDTAARGL